MRQSNGLPKRVLNNDKNKVCTEGKMNDSSLFHVYQLVGGRHYQEDFWSTCLIFEGVYFHAVYDGHGGVSVAKDVMRALKKELTLQIPQFDLKLLADEESVRNLITNIFLKVDEEIFSVSNMSAGCTCSAVLTVCPLNLVYFIQLGDSRAMIMGEKNGILCETKDHKPHFPHEKNRIIAAGGYVTTPNIGPSRVNNILAVSRSFGDWAVELDIVRKEKNGSRHYVYPESCKKNRCCVSKVPDVTRFSLEDHKEKQICLLICSDGLTDKISSGKIFSLLHNEKENQFKTDELEKVLSEMHFDDNVTAMIIIQNLTWP